MCALTAAMIGGCTACDLTIIVKNERVLEVTGSHVHFKSGRKIVLNINKITTGH